MFFQKKKNSEKSKITNTVNLYLRFIPNSTEFLYLPRFPTNGGECAYAATVELVAPPSAHNLKVERLIELSQILRMETKSDDDLTLGWHNPSKYTQPETKRDDWT